MMARKSSRGARRSRTASPSRRTPTAPPDSDVDIRKLDVRPDRTDVRDRPYRPPLVSLPEQYPTKQDIEDYLPHYERLILDQGNEGSCTGFGLAAVVNYLNWRAALDRGEDVTSLEVRSVSPRMLYELARIYDEWPGEDYSGSSCRGAMKGWHRHGVCADNYWQYKARRSTRPLDGWKHSAAQHPLGAYYRITKDDIADMQAAIYEVGAVYASARIHSGWSLGQSQSFPVVISEQRERTGGHAFALVGYTPDGFIVQNSWGSDWGYHGFAVLTYDDWLRNSMDAWVAAMGAPAGREATTESQAAVIGERQQASMPLQRSDPGTLRVESAAATETATTTAPLSEQDALEYTIVIGNDGWPLRRLVNLPNARATVEYVAFERAAEWLANASSNKVAIYAHGGLNSERDSLNRIRILAPYLLANGIYPVFLTWRSGFLESFSSIIEDNLGVEIEPRARFDWGLSDVLRRSQETLAEKRDRAIEVACLPIVKPIWTQMKQNASCASQIDRAMHMLGAQLKALSGQIDDLEIHFIGHSAGAILLGHFLNLLHARRMSVETCSLYAPACSIEFANLFYAKALDRGVLTRKNLFFDLLSDERERDDSVGPYGKSLLYLVSRALEDAHKTPLLGLAKAWEEPADDIWSDNGTKAVEEWLQTWGRDRDTVRQHDQKHVSTTSNETIPIAHGSFDNDINVVENTLLRILGATSLQVQVDNLQGY